MPSPLNITNIPAPRTPLVDPNTGLLAREWYRFFLNLFILTGSGTNPTSLDDLQLGPPTLTIDEIYKIINVESINDLAPQNELGTIAPQNADNVAITGGQIDGTPIGNNSNSTGRFTTLIATSGIGGGTF